MRANQKLTDTYVSTLPFASDPKKPTIYWDSETKGFGIKVNSRDKVYIAEAKVNGKTRRVKIDSASLLGAAAARKEAKILIGQMHDGIDPNDEERVRRERGKLFEEVCNEYIDERPLKARTRNDYKYHMKKTFAGWLKKPILDISRNEAEKLFQKAALISPAQANQAFRFAKAVFNFSKKYRDSHNIPLLKENPIDIISEGRQWKRIAPRTNYITDSQFKPLWLALWSLENSQRSQNLETFRDLILLLLFTGLRLNEALSLRWENIDMQEQLIHIPDTKNHRPHMLPMSNYLVSLFERRKKLAGSSSWVFPSHQSEGKKHIGLYKRTFEQLQSVSQLTFTPHDLRRTFSTVASQIPEINSVYIIKRLMNHQGDVTSRYIQQNVEELRRAMQKITDYILEKSEAKYSRIGMSQLPPTPPARAKRIIRHRKAATVKVST